MVRDSPSVRKTSFYRLTPPPQKHSVQPPRVPYISFWLLFYFIAVEHFRLGIWIEGATKRNDSLWIFAVHTLSEFPTPLLNSQRYYYSKRHDSKNTVENVYECVCGYKAWSSRHISSGAGFCFSSGWSWSKQHAPEFAFGNNKNDCTAISCVCKCCFVDAKRVLEWWGFIVNVLALEKWSSCFRIFFFVEYIQNEYEIVAMKISG